MTAVVLLSHGSRHQSAATGVTQLARAVAQRTHKEVVTAHMDFHDHTLDYVCQNLKAKGHKHATVVPLLFTNAYHHKVDVPALVNAHTELNLELSPHLGTGEDIAEILAPNIPAGAYPVVYAVGSSHSAANADVEKLAARLGGEAIFATNSTRTLADVNHARIHILPLFVTEGLLLEKLRAEFPPTTWRTYSPPLRESLVEVVEQRCITPKGVGS